MSITLAVIGIFLAGSLPLLPLLIRPLARHRDPKIARVGRVLAMAAFWLVFNASFLAIFGTFYVPEAWELALGFAVLQAPALWLSHRIAFATEEATVRRAK